VALDATCIFMAIHLYGVCFTCHLTFVISELLYLRKRAVFFDGRFFSVFEIYEHCNPVVICISYCGTKIFVAECCSIKNLKHDPENFPPPPSKLLVWRTSLFLLSSLMPLQWLLKHLFRPVVYTHTCLSLPTILSILPASEILVELVNCFLNAH
jgi:hypothetical protein